MNRKMQWSNSIKTKQLFLLFIIILFIIICSFFFFNKATQIAVDSIYQQMEAQAEYYVDSVDTQIAGIMQQQSDFFMDRKLSFLASRELLNDDYERRETLLTLQDRLFSLKSSNRLIKKIILYVPGADYIITPSEVTEFTEEDLERLEIIKKQIGKMSLEEESLSYTLSESYYAEGQTPAFCLQVIFDEQQLRENLNDFASSEGGACWYGYQQDWFLEDTKGNYLGVEILEQLKKKAWLEPQGIKELEIGKTPYLISTVESDHLGMLFQYYSKESIMAEMSLYSRLFGIFIIMAVAMAVLFSSYTERMVNRPLQKLYRAFDILRQGNMDIQITHSAKDEFNYIYEGFNHMTHQLKRLIDEIYIQKNLAQKAELKQLQAQINPHFLYNSFFVLSRRVKKGDMENAQLLAEYLGTYFQYLTRNTADIVTLKKEIEHAECYARIQATRFAGRIAVELDPFPGEVEDLLVPRLILQPILENAFEHGLEDKEEDGILKVTYTVAEKYVRIYIENNGDLQEEQLRLMENMLGEGYGGEVTGMINIHRRLKSFYQGEGGLEIAGGILGGIQVTVYLPKGAWGLKM